MKKKEGNWMKRLLSNRGLKRTMLYCGAGAIAGFVFFYLTEGGKWIKCQREILYKA